MLLLEVERQTGQEGEPASACHAQMHAYHPGPVGEAFCCADANAVGGAFPCALVYTDRGADHSATLTEPIEDTD